MTKHNIYQGLTVFACLAIIAIVIMIFGFFAEMLIVISFLHPLIFGSLFLFYLLSFLDSLTSLFSPNRRKYRVMIITHAITLGTIIASITLYCNHSAVLKEKELIRYRHPASNMGNVL
jgi:hypothetical protein